MIALIRRTSRLRGHLLALLLAPALAACDAAGGVLLGGTVGGAQLGSGAYAYDSWSEDGELAWWGDLQLSVLASGEIRGEYRLPGQCTAGSVVVDCVGYVGGRVQADGTVRFGLDEGWLRNEGRVLRASLARGEWETRILGYYDQGRWELRRL